AKIEWHGARQGVLQALAARRRHVIGAAPGMDLLLAEASRRVLLVEAGELAIIALVEGAVADRLESRLTDFLEDQRQRVLGADETAGIGLVEDEAALLEPSSGRAGLALPKLRQRRILPAGEEVLQVPFALAVPHQHRDPFHPAHPPPDPGPRSRTSIMV